MEPKNHCKRQTRAKIEADNVKKEKKKRMRHLKSKSLANKRGNSSISTSTGSSTCSSADSVDEGDLSGQAFTVQFEHTDYKNICS